MNGSHFHLVVNHLPIIFPIVGLLVLIVGFISKSEHVKRTSLLIFIIGALTTMLAMKSGEEAEEFVENMEGFDRKIIHIHEEAAEVFAYLNFLLGGLSIFGLWVSFKNKSFKNIIYIVVIVYTLIVLFFSKNAGTTGGEIRHLEIRSNEAVTSPEKD